MIDRNKQYRTRDGREVRIYAVDGSGNKPIHGASLSVVHGWTSHVWSSNGRFYGDVESMNDLIEVKPRIKREVWVNEYRYCNGQRNWVAFDTRDEADSEPAARIACVMLTIDCEEGEGL